MPVVYKVMLYIILDGLTSPAFDEFAFYFNTNVRGVTQMEMGIMDSIGNFGSLFGVVIFSAFLRNYEVKNLLYINWALGYLGAFCDLFFIFGYNK